MLLIVLLVLSSAAAAQGVKRIVMVKVDGLPGQLVDKYVNETDPATGRSQLPWMQEVFYRNGTRLDNFYTRGMSLSGPSWGTIDTGQHLQIRGNVEYDRYTLHAYDYLNFVPFYVGFGLKKLADMPAVEVLDQLGMPIMLDAFPHTRRYHSPQLYQRGFSWRMAGHSFVNLYPGSPSDMIDEWTMGLDLFNVTMRQGERDIVERLTKRPEIDYLDYYDVSFDHVAHGNNDPKAQLADLKKLDRTIGRFWTAIRDSSRAAETAIVVVSDHGFNSEPKVYSQGYNLVKLLGKRSAGGHHVVTKRRLMMDYSVKGLYPFTPLIKTASDESLYLRGQNKEYPTALFDFDGNERASVQLRNSDLNVLHILLQQLQQKGLAENVRRAAVDEVFAVVDRNRPRWQATVSGLTEELAALQRGLADGDRVANDLAAKVLPGDEWSSAAIAARRKTALNELSRREIADYTKYLATLKNLLALRKDSFDARGLKVEDLIAPGAMGDHNSTYQLQNYVAGLSPRGLVIDAGGRLDTAASFSRVNYFQVFTSQTVRNNVQPAVGNRPVDFLATVVPREAFGDVLSGDLRPDADPIWLYVDGQRQALLLTHKGPEGMSIRYLPVSWLTASADGSIGFEPRDWAAGLPLKIFEDLALDAPTADRVAWLNEWHTEAEWLKAVHRTQYSNGIIGLIEQLARHDLPTETMGLTADQQLVRRFRERQRSLAEADMLIMASEFWNFDVKGFNPGGNHGSFFRKSTNSTFMLAGGDLTGIPRGLRVEEPYDNLSVLPTIFRLMGRVDAENRPDAALSSIGFRRFPGRAVSEVFGK
jgi:hypothetical protein